MHNPNERARDDYTIRAGFGVTLRTNQRYGTNGKVFGHISLFRQAQNIARALGLNRNDPEWSASILYVSRTTLA